MFKCGNFNTTFGLGAGWPLEEIEMPSVVEPSDNDGEDDLKVILDKKKYFWANLIFSIVMRCGIADSGW